MCQTALDDQRAMPERGAEPLATITTCHTTIINSTCWKSGPTQPMQDQEVRFMQRNKTPQTSSSAHKNTMGNPSTQHMQSHNTQIHHQHQIRIMFV